MALSSRSPDRRDTMPDFFPRSQGFPDGDYGRAAERRLICELNSPKGDHCLCGLTLDRLAGRRPHDLVRASQSREPAP